MLRVEWLSNPTVELELELEKKSPSHGGLVFRSAGRHVPFVPGGP